jgi:hypothetical protein
MRGTRCRARPMNATRSAALALRLRRSILHRRPLPCIDGARKHSPWPLNTTTGAQRNPGVHVRLRSGKPDGSQASPLEPRVQGRFREHRHGGGCISSRDARPSPRIARNPCLGAGFVFVCSAPRRGFCLCVSPAFRRRAFRPELFMDLCRSFEKIGPEGPPTKPTA